MVSTKTYFDFMKEIFESELFEGLLGYGMFAKNLPPVFTSKPFYDYCVQKNPNLPNVCSNYVYYESIRNNNTPRSLGIPNPIAYKSLCETIMLNWQRLIGHFEDKTKGQEHIVSRIHIRKINGKKELFEMNYGNWKTDGTPEPDLLFGAKYMVHADIANCFPSIYTHALPWALVGKNAAKKNRSDKNWYNKIDKYTRNIKNGETHGLLIGPHASNLLSEIILTSIDKKLCSKGWRYVRNIDDYTCYAESFEKAQLFLTDLSEQLREFDLLMNHKKTKIQELPQAAIEQWVRKLNSFLTVDKKTVLNYKEVQAYLDLAVELMQKNNNNAAVIKYVAKVLARKKLSENAKIYYIKTMCNLTILYPYLITMLEEYVFNIFYVDIDTINKFSQLLYCGGINTRNYEAVRYALYFALKYNFEIKGSILSDAKQSNDCLFKLFAYLYYEKRGDHANAELLKDHARALMASDMDAYWIFIYEVLEVGDLSDYWKTLKSSGVSFLLTI